MAKPWKTFAATPTSPERERFDADLRERHPAFLEAVGADAKAQAQARGDRHEFGSTLDLWLQVVRLCVVTDAFFAVLCYRAKTECQKRQLPLLPRLFHRMAMRSAQLSIGDPVVVQPGFVVLHGSVVIDGITSIGADVRIAPFVTVGLIAADYVGPTIGDGARIGTGAKILGSVTVGTGVIVGANSVVLGDVPDGGTVVGSPARLIGEES